MNYSIRRLTAAPGFSVTVILILALGIGANSALFTALDRTVIRALPYPNPDRLVALWEDFAAFGNPKNRVAPATFLDWTNRTHSFQELAAYNARFRNLSGGGPPEEVLGLGATSNLLAVLGVEPAMGRTFTAEEQAPGNKVVILSHALWQRRYNSDANIIGRSIVMSDESYTIIGVMPRGFQYPDRQTEFWTPLGLSPELLARRNSHFLQVIGRLKPAATPEEARADLATIAQDLARDYPTTNAKVGITMVPLKDEFLGQTGNTFIILLCSACCVLLIACANVGNLLLARSAARQREVAIRTALGASPGRVLRQLLTENLVLAVAGGAAGLVLAAWIRSGLESMLAPNFVGLVDLRPDWRTIVFTAAIALCTGLVFGIAPSFRLMKAGISGVLQGAGRADVVPAGSRLRDILVVAEIAIALVLVVGAVLLIQTLVMLRNVDPGFRAGGILTAQAYAPTPKYDDARTRQQFYSRVLENIRAIPGVTSAGLTSDLPYTTRGNTMSIKIEGRAAGGLGNDVLFRLVSDHFLETMSAVLIAGRFPNANDQMDTLPIVMVNEALARQYFPNENPIGRRIDTGTGDGSAKWMTIVGVVRDVRERGLDFANKAAVYVPFTQTTIGFFVPSDIALLTTRDPLSLTKELQQAVWSVDPEQPVTRIRTMETIVDGEVANRTQVMRLLGSFAGLALVLAAFGTYGVLSYLVSLRTREIGLRMAIGANHWNIARSILLYTARLTAMGITFGVLIALGATRLLSSLLFGVSPLDPGTFVMVSLGLALVSFLASLAPLVRAMRVDPIIALRSV